MLARSQCESAIITRQTFWYIPWVSTFQLRSWNTVGTICRGPWCFSAITLCWVNKSTFPSTLKFSWLCWDSKLYTIYWKTYVAMSVLRENKWKLLSIGTASTQRSPFASAHSINLPLTLVIHSPHKPKSLNYDTKNSR